MEQVTYKDTITVEFNTQLYDTETEATSEVVPDSYEAWLETGTYDRQQIIELDVTAVDTTTFLVRFYASEDTHADVVSGGTYFISFYWEYLGVKKCSPYGIEVVGNV